MREKAQLFKLSCAFSEKVIYTSFFKILFNEEDDYDCHVNTTFLQEYLVQRDCPKMFLE